MLVISIVGAVGILMFYMAGGHLVKGGEYRQYQREEKPLGRTSLRVFFLVGTVVVSVLSGKCLVLLHNFFH